MDGNRSGAAIELHGLSRAFGRRTVVDGLDLQVERGEVFGLIGPDGAGKTTTLRMLTGVLSSTQGTGKVGGFDLAHDSESLKRHIGYMPQQFSLYGDLTVMENLLFFADLYHVSTRERKERIPRLLGFSRLEPFKERRAAHLSGGMQKKLGLACTLIHQPEIVFLDEPTTGVDPVSRREFWDILGELHLDGVTLVVSTPYMDEAERCSRVGLMFDGRLIACNSPAVIRGQIRGELLEILPESLKGAVAALEGQPGVLEVQTYGDLLHVFVDDVEARTAALQARLAEAGCAVRWMRRTAPRMEEAFVSMVRQERARPAGDEKEV